MSVKCTYCGAELLWDTGNRRSCNPDGTPHCCPESKAARAKAYRRKHAKTLRQNLLLLRDFQDRVGREP